MKQLQSIHTVNKHVLCIRDKKQVKFDIGASWATSRPILYFGT